MTNKVDKRIDEQSIVVDADGTLLMWVNGYLSGDQTLIREIKTWCRLGQRVPLVEGGVPVKCVWDDPMDTVGACAALLSARRGRTRLLQAPAMVIDFILVTSPDSLTTSTLPEDPQGDAVRPVSDISRASDPTERQTPPSDSQSRTDGQVV